MTNPTRIALAADPGPTRSALALVTVDDAGWFHIGLGHHIDNEDRYLRSVIAHAATNGALFAIESIFGFAYEAKRVQALCETTRMEGRLMEIIRAAGAASHLVPAREWRGELCGTETPSDEQVRIVVEGLCRTIPTIRAEARAHVYDAAGLAIVAIARGMRRRVVLPPAVRIALMAQQAVDQAARTAKRAAKKARAAAGLPPETARRSITRAQSGRRSAAGKRSWAARRST
jgi:hypothetical protein